MLWGGFRPPFQSLLSLRTLLSAFSPMMRGDPALVFPIPMLQQPQIFPAPPRALMEGIEGKLGPGGTTWHIYTPVEAPLDQVVASTLEWSLEDATRLIMFGAVYTDVRTGKGNDFGSKVKRTMEPGKIIEEGGYVRLYPSPKQHPECQVDWEALVVHEDDHCIVIDKPTGVPCHALVDNMHQNVISCMNTVLAARGKGSVIGTTRLDVETSGLLVLGKSSEWVNTYHLLIQPERVKNRSKVREEEGGGDGVAPMQNVRKKYRALVHKAATAAAKDVDEVDVAYDDSASERHGSGCGCAPLEAGEKRHFIAPGKYAPRKFSRNSMGEDWKECRLMIEDVVDCKGMLNERLPEAFHEPDACVREVRMELMTGRTHQIRGQLSCDGWPVVGDALYGPDALIFTEVDGSPFMPGYRCYRRGGKDGVGHVKEVGPTMCLQCCGLSFYTEQTGQVDLNLERAWWHK
ncbi:unnamed protein product [Chrysoparadoxa australica]